MHELLYNVLSLILLLAFGALVWFRRRLRMAQILLVLSSFGLLFWFSAGFDWRVFDERPYATPPPDQCWNLAETTVCGQSCRAANLDLSRPGGQPPQATTVWDRRLEPPALSAPACCQ
jgi:hypothetical protein